ncbi:MAG: hypothetical protein H0V41_19415 [Pseudonocardiales bacterium]|nr:hypothetical protein [Pseudonocardiales bacterium]
MTTPRQRGGSLPETTERFLTGLPRHGDPVGAVWNRLAQLERAGNDSIIIDTLRAVLLLSSCTATGDRRWSWAQR